MKYILVGVVGFIAVVGGFFWKYRNNLPEWKCLAYDKIVLLGERDNKLVIVSACRGRIIEELDVSKYDIYPGREGLLVLEEEPIKLLVKVPEDEQVRPNEVWEESRPDYKSLRYFDYKTKKWSNLTIPKLVSNDTRFEKIFFTPSIDSGGFVAFIDMYDTKSSEFFNRFMGPTPASGYSMALNPVGGVYTPLDITDKANIAINKINQSESRWFEYVYGSCRYDALGVKKSYMFPCGEGIGVAGPIVEYDAKSDSARIVSKEKILDKIFQGYHPIIPFDGNLYYYLANPKIYNVNKEDGVYVAGKRTELNVYEKGTDELLISTVLDGTNLDKGKIINVVKKGEENDLYFTFQLKTMTPSGIERVDFLLYKVKLQRDSVPVMVSRIVDAGSCGKDGLVYIPGSSDRIVFVQGNTETEYMVTGLKRLEKINVWGCH